MYSTHKEGRAVAAERFMRTLKNKTCRYMTSVSKNVYIATDNNTYHSKIIMKTPDVKPNTYIDFNKKKIKKKILNLKLMIM